MHSALAAGERVEVTPSSIADGLSAPHAGRNALAIVREQSPGYGEGDAGNPWTPVGLGRVPVRVHGLGVYYRRFFEPVVLVAIP